MQAYLKECEIPTKFSEAMATYVEARKYKNAHDPWANSLWNLPPKLMHVVSSIPCPLVWRLIEMLVHEGVGEFLKRLKSVIDTYKKSAETLAQNLLRLAFEYQSLHGSDGPKKWEEEIVKTFKEWETASEKPEAYDCVVEWACKNASEKDQNGGVTQVKSKVLEGKYKPAFPITDTGKKNTGLTKQRTIIMALSGTAISEQDNEKLDEVVLPRMDYASVITVDYIVGGMKIEFTYRDADQGPAKADEMIQAIQGARQDAKVEDTRDKWEKRHV